MAKATRYAVVDTETTGTDIEAGDRIIQFSVSFVENGQVVDNFDTYINDGEKIPAEITHLTGITSETIKDAPSFDQVAPRIYKMLQGCVFVAHNVNFDFPFINAELGRVGFPELITPAVDTVTLTQLFFPTLKSYHLKNLSKHFNIQHNRPHSSASDAFATAKLLIKIKQKIESLPAITLKEIIQASPKLPMDTFSFIKEAAKQKLQKAHNQFQSEFEVNGIALKEPKTPQAAEAKPIGTFPNGKKQKARMFADSLEFRDSQSKMMNLIFKNYSDKKRTAKNLLIEAPTGSGKTLGYLIPMAYLAGGKFPVVISTATIGLEQQLKQVIEKQLNPLLKTDFKPAVLKGMGHYIDLNRFKKSLAVSQKSAQAQFLKSQVLVWLLETDTGDLDELNFSDESPFFNEINYQQRPRLDDSNPFSQVDFLRRQKNLIQVSDFIIVNHAYLLENSKLLNKELTQKAYLIIDEASNLAQAAFAKNEAHFSFHRVKKNVSKIKNDLFQSHSQSISSLFANNPEVTARIAKLSGVLDQLESDNNALVNDFGERFQRRAKSTADLEKPLNNKTLLSFIKEEHSLFVSLFSLNQRLSNFLLAMQSQKQQNPNQFTPQDLGKINGLIRHLSGLNTFLNSLENGIANFKKNPDQAFFWIRSRNFGSYEQTVFYSGQFTPQNELRNQIYQYFQPAVFTGAALFTSKKSQFIFNQLDLNRENTRMKRLKSDFTNSDNFQLLVSKNTPEPQDESNEEYVSYLANSIWKLLNAAKQPTLVLFNSNALIEAVYQKLKNFNTNNLFSILASGITGSQGKITRRFENEKNPVILGSNGFFEGVDFKKHLLKQIIITRLPFANPNDPVVRAKSNFLKQQSKNPFSHYELPNAILFLKQGMGRMIRNPDDFGSSVLLDNRIITKKYGGQIVKALPANIQIKEGSITDLEEKTKDFFSDR